MSTNKPDFEGVAKVFWTGWYQALRLPAAYRFETDEVIITRAGSTDIASAR